jgi:hypothetical protein
MMEAVNSAVDYGDMKRMAYESFAARLAALDRGPDARSTFMNTRRTVVLATEVISLDEFERHLEQANRRIGAERRVTTVTSPPADGERRRHDRRTPSQAAALVEDIC